MILRGVQYLLCYQLALAHQLFQALAKSRSTRYFLSEEIPSGQMLVAILGNNALTLCPFSTARPSQDEDDFGISWKLSSLGNS